MAKCLINKTDLWEVGGAGNWLDLVWQDSPGIHGGKDSYGSIPKYVGFGCRLHIRQLMLQSV